MDDVDHGRRAEVLTKVADQLLEQLTIERKSNDVMRELVASPSRPMSASQRRALAAAAAVVAFVVPLAIAKLTEPPPPPPIVATVPVASPTVKALEPLPAPAERLIALGPPMPPVPPGLDEHHALTADQVRAVVREGRADVERCYERAVRARQLPLDDLRVTVSATVEATGRVSTVHVTPAPAPFRSCVSAAVQRWQFPRATGSSRPEIPFLFTHTSTVASRP